jgi:hypothetical protein
MKSEHGENAMATAEAETRGDFPSLDELWKAPSRPASAFNPGELHALPVAAQRLLRSAIALGTSLTSTVRLMMHGEIKLKTWLPFTAEEVIAWPHGFLWGATVRQNGMPIRGFDGLVDGVGAQRWKLFGLVSVVSASGSDITRSAAGRLAAEALWLPSILCDRDVAWSAIDEHHPCARLAIAGETVEPCFEIDDAGQVRSVVVQRWGDPEKAGFGYHAFGGYVEQRAAFNGFTIPTRLRIGYHVGTDKFESHGEFIRITIDDAIYR